MGVPLEIGKMFFYIMIPISFFHYYSHQDPDYYRKIKEDRQNNLFGYGSKLTEEYVKKQAEEGLKNGSYNSNDAFWTYGAGLRAKEEIDYSQHKM